MKRLGFLLAAMLLAGVMPVCAVAQETGAPLDHTQFFLTPTPEILHRIAGLVAAGRYDEARKQLLLFRLQPRPHLEVLFLSGMIYEHEGDYQLAATEFRLMLSRDPTLVRPRLELARALFLAKDYAGARYHFQQVLTSNLPPVVREKVQGYLTAIREQLPSFTLNFNLISDSNPRQSTSNKTVTIGGRTYQLNVTAPDKSIWGYELSGNARIPFSEDASWFSSTSMDLIDYPNSDNDQFYLLTTLGKRTHLGRHALSLEMGAQIFEYRWRKLYDGMVWRAGDFLQQSDRSAWQATLEGRQQNYPDYSYLDGWQYNLSLENRYSSSISNHWQSGARYSHNQAREQPYAYSNPSLFVHYVHEWSGGLISGIRWQQSKFDYQGIDPFFGMVRHDRERVLEVDVVNRNWHILDMAPRLLLGNIEHTSNMSLYAFRRSYIKVGVSREF